MTPQEAVDSLNLSIASVFVPFSQSRNKAEKLSSLNWKVTLKMGEREIITADYSAGCGHCPAYKLSIKEAGGLDSIMRDEMIRKECEEGLVYFKRGFHKRATKIEPETLDVIYSLVSDSDVLDHPTFEDWAENFGYDTDSRSAYKSYKACLETAIKIRSYIGPNQMEMLRKAFREY